MRESSSWDIVRASGLHEQQYWALFAVDSLGGSYSCSEFNIYRQRRSQWIMRPCSSVTGDEWQHLHFSHARWISEWWPSWCTHITHTHPNANTEHTTFLKTQTAYGIIQFNHFYCLSSCGSEIERNPGRWFQRNSTFFSSCFVWICLTLDVTAPVTFHVFLGYFSRPMQFDGSYFLFSMNHS